MEYLHSQYPKEAWTHVYTDGSAEEAVRNGGAGIFIQYPGGREDRISIPTGTFSTNYKAEADALSTAATFIETSPHSSKNVVFLSDALSVLQALQTSRSFDLIDLSSALYSLCRKCTVVLQWIPSHCNIHGNEAADRLAKRGTTEVQTDRSTSYSEVKTIIKAKQHSRWTVQHPHYNKADPYYQLTRQDQVVIFRLRTGHNRLNHHMFSKFRIGLSEQCFCGAISQTEDHLLQSCPLHDALRKRTWPNSTTVAQKLYGGLEDLQVTATFVRETGVSI